MRVSLVLLLLAPWFGIASAHAAVSAQVAGNQLVIGGDGAPNQITLRLFAFDDSQIQVLDGAAIIGQFARATFTSIVINAVGGNDTIVLSRIFGPITEKATIDGGLGDDTIRGGAGNDDLLGGSGNDRILWNPGDGDDVIDGNDGIDVVEVNGTNADDELAAAGVPAVSRVEVTATGVAGKAVIGTVETLEVNMLGGNDQFFTSGTFNGAITFVVNGGDGDDSLTGSPGPDILRGGNGRDAFAGRAGDDLLEGGAENDFFFWGAGDGNDTVEAGEGSDLLAIFGDGTNEIVTIAPSGGRLRVTHSPGNSAIDADDVENVGVEAEGGNDTVTATDGLGAVGVLSVILHGGPGNDQLTAGDTANDELDGDGGDDVLNGGAGGDFLIAGPGFDTMNGGAGDDFLIWNDGAGDLIFDGEAGVDKLGVVGSNNADVFNVFGSGQSFSVSRPAGNINLSGLAEELEILTLEGNDNVNVKGGLATILRITIDTGAGADAIDTVASAVITVNGNDDRDTIVFDALSQPVSTTPSTLTVGGLTRVTHSQVESVLFLNLLGTLPSIAITSPTADPATAASTPFLALAGSVNDAEGIASIGVMNDRGGSSVAGIVPAPSTGFAGASKVWAAPHVPLAAGANVLTATVRDTSGNEVSDTLTVNVNAFTYTLAEGSTGSFFDTDILIANPNAEAAPVTITYLKGDGTTVPQALTLAPTSRTTIRVDAISGLENTEVSATVTSTAALPIVVERTMRWDATRYGAHTEKATDGPAKTWFFAEGSQGFFDTYVLLANPGPIANTATVTFLLESGEPVVKSFQVAPTSRFTVAANATPEIVGRSFGIVVSFTEPGVAERAMYFGARLFDAGHESAGVNAPSVSWFLAEGATGSFFTTFVLLANPGTADATATVTFLPDSGAAVTRTKTVLAGQRVTLNIAAEDASLASGAIATAVQSTQPILVERAQYWPSTPDRWYEAHNAFGSTAVGTKWGLAEGRVGGPEGYQTFILLANADPTQAAQVRITFLRENGTTVVKTFTVNPSSRFNVQVNSIPELANESFGALVEVTAGASIFVERALYADAQGVTFAAGTNALATRLP